MRRSRAARCADLLYSEVPAFKSGRSSMSVLANTAACGSVHDSALQQKCLLDRKRSYLTEKGLFSRKADCGGCSVTGIPTAILQNHRQSNAPRSLGVTAVATFSRSNRP